MIEKMNGENLKPFIVLNETQIEDKAEEDNPFKIMRNKVHIE